MSDKSKIYDYIKRTINPCGRPFEGTAYEFGLKIMDFIENIDGGKENGWIPVSERLTKRYIDEDDGRKSIGIFNGCIVPEICFEGERGYQVFEKLAEYEDLEEQDLLVRLPCKVGDTVYRVNAGAKQPIILMTVSEIHFLCYKNERAVRFDAVGKEDMGESCYRLEDIGRIVFLTNEEAEKKLEELKNEI